MAFTILTGVMGSGKSWYGAELAIQAARRGAIVHTNLPLCLDWWNDNELVDQLRILPPDFREWVYEGEVPPPDERGRVQKPPLHSDIFVAGQEGAENLVIVDEAALDFDVDEQGNKDAKSMWKPIFRLIALCRHAGLDLYFISQHQDNIPAKMRKMAEYRIKCVKTERLPVIGWLFAMLPWYGQFLRLHYHGQSATPSAQTWHKFSKEIGASYKTHGMRSSLAFQTATGGRKADEVTQRKGKLAALGFAVLILSLVCASWMMGSSAYSRIVGDEKPATATATAAPASSPAPVAPSRSRPARSLEWAEWTEEDEFIIRSVIRDPRGVRIYSTGGLLAVGEHFDGERVESMRAWAGRYFFFLPSGRCIVARPQTFAERRAGWEAAIAAAKEKSLKERLIDDPIKEEHP